MITIDDAIKNHKEIETNYKWAKRKLLENAYEFFKANLMDKPNKMVYCMFYGFFDWADGGEKEVERIELEYNDLFEEYDVRVYFTDDTNEVWDEELFYLSENDILTIFEGIKRNNTFAE